MNFLFKACLITFLFFSISCQQKPVQPSTLDALNDIEVHIHNPDRAVEITGKNYSIYWQDQDSLLSENFKKKVTLKVQNEMQKKGYTEVKTLRKGHITVFLTSSGPEEEQSRITIKTTTETFERVNNKVKYKKRTVEGVPAKFEILLTSNSYGQRYKGFGSYSFVSNKKNWEGLEETLSLLVTEIPFSFLPAAPLKNQKMQGDPGCQPRLGYEVNPQGIITRVENGSPALDAGLKVKDQLIAIDSENYKVAISEEIYKSNLKVPIKFKRGETIHRAQIQPRIMCN